MAPLHLLMATMKSGRRKEIITTEGVEEGGREGEEEGGVVTMEGAGVAAAAATAMTMAMVAEVGTMKSRMNTMMSLRNMVRPLAVVSLS